MQKANDCVEHEQRGDHAGLDPLSQNHLNDNREFEHPRNQAPKLEEEHLRATGVLLCHHIRSKSLLSQITELKKPV